MMCEIPSNAVLADEFLQFFDGFSIGSNDMTQLILGLDRDSVLIAYLFDERNPAVKKMLRMAIQAGKTVRLSRPGRLAGERGDQQRLAEPRHGGRHLLYIAKQQEK